MATTATKKKTARKKATKKSAKKKAANKAASNGKAKLGNAAGSPSPTAPLPGMEDIDKKIPAIETAIKRIVDRKAERIALKDEIDAELSKLPGLFRKHDVDSYKAYGRMVQIERGADVVKIKKVKEQ